MLSWLSLQRYVSQPSSLHMRRTWFWEGPTYEAPRSTHPNCGSPASADGVSVSVRPPTRSLASRTTTSTPRSWRSFAALKPDTNHVWLKKFSQEISCVKFKLKTNISEFSFVSSIRVNIDPDARDRRGLWNVVFNPTLKWLIAQEDLSAFIYCANSNLA